MVYNIYSVKIILVAFTVYCWNSWILCISLGKYRYVFVSINRLC